MKKTVLVLITFALIIAVAGSGFWLVHYFIDSREQRQTYENLAEEFVLESTPSVRPESSSSLDSSVDAGVEDVGSPVDDLDAPPRHDLAALAEKMRIVWGGLPFPTRESIIPSCTRRMTRSTTCAGISTVNPPAEGHPSWMVGTWQKQKIRTSFSTATT